MAFGPISNPGGGMNATAEDLFNTVNAGAQGTIPQNVPANQSEPEGLPEDFNPYANGPANLDPEPMDPQALQNGTSDVYGEDFNPYANGPANLDTLPDPVQGTNKPNSAAYPMVTEARAQQLDPEAYVRNAREVQPTKFQRNPTLSRPWDQFDNDPIVSVGVDNFTKLSYWPAKGLSKALKEAQAVGISPQFSPLQSTRTYDEQAGLHGKLGKYAAPPGKTKSTGSLHQFGFAIDVGLPEEQYTELDPIMAKYGFARPFADTPGERHHYAFQPALSPTDPERVWKDSDPRMKSWKTGSGYAAPGTTDDLIVNAAQVRGFGPRTTSTFSRMLDAESGKRTKGADGNIITSPAGAVGIGQMMPATLAPYLKSRGLTYEDYKNNDNVQIEIAAEHFDNVLKANKGNLAKTLAEYNGGPGAVQYAETRGAYPPSDRPEAWSNETLNYVAKILDVSKEQAMKWIAQPEGDEDTGPMADYGADAVDYGDARTQTQQWLSLVQGLDSDSQGAAMGLGAASPQAYNLSMQDYQEGQSRVIDRNTEWATRGLKTALTAFSSDILGVVGHTGKALAGGSVNVPYDFAFEGAQQKMRDAGVPSVSVGLGGVSFPGTKGSPEYDQDVGRRHSTGATKLFQPMIDLANWLHPGSIDPSSQAHADMLRDSSSLIGYIGRLPWSPEEGGTDLSWRGVEGNLQSMGLAIPHFLGATMGAIALGPEMGLMSGEEFASANAAVAAKAMSARATGRKALEQIGMLPKIGGAVSQGLEAAFAGPAAHLENILTYAGIGTGQAMLEGYGEALRGGGTLQEAVASAITNGIVGGLMGIALPFGIPALKGAGSVVGETGARAVAKVLGGEIPANLPWKDYTAHSVLEYVQRMDKATGDKFTNRMATKVLPFLEYVFGTDKRAVVIKQQAGNLLEASDTYANAAKDLDAQVSNHNQYVDTLMEARDTAMAEVKRMEQDPTVKQFAGKVAPALDRLDALATEFENLPKMDPAQRQEWAQANQQVLKEAGAKDVDDLVIPTEAKNGVPTSKGSKYIDDARKKVFANTPLTPAQMFNYRKALNGVKQADQRLAMAQQHPLVQDRTQLREAVAVLNHTAQHLKQRAEWLTEHAKDPIQPLGDYPGTPFGVVDTQNPHIEPELLGANLDRLNDFFQQMVNDKTYFGISKDLVAFEATRGTRALLQGIGLDPEAFIKSNVAGLEEAVTQVKGDLAVSRRNVENAQATVRRLEKEGSPEVVAARHQRDLAIAQDRHLKAETRLEDLRNQREAHLTRQRELTWDDTSVHDVSDAHFETQRKLLRDAESKVRVADGLAKVIEEQTALRDDLSKGITEDTVRKYQEYLRFNYGLMSELDDSIASAGKGVTRAQKKIDWREAKLKDVKEGAAEARALAEQTRERLDKMREYKNIQRKIDSANTKEPVLIKRLNKARGELDGFDTLFAKKENKAQAGRDRRIAQTQQRIELHQAEKDSLVQSVEQFSKGIAAFQGASEQMVAPKLSTRGPDPFMSELAAPDIMHRPTIAGADPLKEARDLHNGPWSPDYRREQYAQQLLAATDTVLDILNPSRASLKVAGGSPDPWVNLKAGGEQGPRDNDITRLLTQELAESLMSVRVDEMVAEEAAKMNPLKAIPKETVEGLVEGLNGFSKADIAQGITTGWQRARLMWKTYTNQLGHSRAVANRIQEGWHSMVQHLPEGYLSGKGTKRGLSPEVSKDMARAIEGMLEGPQAMREFLTKYPEMQKPMQLYLGVARVLEQYKISSPELRAQFRDGYLLHTFPRARELAGRGIPVNIKSMKTTLGSEEKRVYESLELAQQEYQNGLDQVLNGEGWRQNEPSSANAREKHFLDASKQDRARILNLDYTTPEARTIADKKAQSIINRLALKDPVTDPGKLMSQMVQSTMDASAIRNGLRNIAHIQLREFRDSGLGDGARVPIRALEENPGMMVTTKDGSQKAMVRLDQIEGLHIAPDDTITFGGKDYLAKDLGMHPDIAKDFAWAFASRTNDKAGAEASRAFHETLRTVALIGSPMSHAWNILSGHWQTLSVNALSSMWKGAWEMAAGAGKLDPAAIAEGVKGIATGAKDMALAPFDALGTGVLGNRMMKGDVNNISPQLLLSDAMLHGLNMKTWNTAIKEATEAVVNLIQREDPVLGEMFKPKTRVEQMMVKEKNLGDAWESVVSRDGMFREVYDLKGGGSVSGAAKAMVAGTTKMAANADYLANNFLTYEPMRQAALASYYMTAATHWEAMKGPMAEAGIPAATALKMVKEEAARYVNNRTGTLAAWNKVQMGANKENWDVEGDLYGTTGNNKRSITGYLLNASTPGWLRSKIELISNGTFGKRLADIENPELREYMTKEWRKQLALGLGTTMVAQQLLKFAMSGGEAGLFAAVFNSPDKVGSDEYNSRLTAEVQDPKQFTELRLGNSNYTMNAPFYGQMRDALAIGKGILLQPSAITDLITSNMGKTGVAALEMATGRDMRTGYKYRLDDSSPEIDSKMDWIGKTLGHGATKQFKTFSEDVLQYDTREGHMKPLWQIAAGAAGIHIRKNEPGSEIPGWLREREKYFTNQTKDTVEAHVKEFVRTKDPAKMEEAFKACMGEYVTGSAKQMNLVFPTGRALISPDYVGDMLLKYNNRGAYDLNSMPPEMQAEYLRLHKRYNYLQNTQMMEAIVNQPQSETDE